MVINQYLITALIDICLGLFALSKKSNPAAKALAFTTFSLGGWSFELYLLTVVSDVEVLDVWFHVSRWGMFFIPPSFALLTWRIVGASSTLFFRLVVLPGFACSMLLGITNLFFLPSLLSKSVIGYLPKVDSVYYMFVGIFLWCFCGAICLSILRFRVVTQREKKRVKWLLITLLVSFLGGAFNLFVMPNDMYLSNYMGSVLNIVFVALLFYSTIQHQLMDLRSVISAGISRIVLLTFFVWTIFFFFSLSGPLDKGSSSFVVLAILIVVFLELYPRLLKWILPGAKKLIEKDGYDFNLVISDAVLALNECMSLSHLRRACDHLFYQVVRVTTYKIVVFDSENKASQVSESEIELLDVYCSEVNGVVFADEAPEKVRAILFKCSADACFSIDYKGSNLGFVFTGPIASHAYYRYDDIRVFEWLRLELGKTLSRINQLDKMEDQLGQAKKTLSMLSVMNHYHHDIKAPLAIIDGVLSNDIYDKEKQKDIVLEQVERGSQLIATMAGILKGERKRKVIALPLEDVVKDSVFLFNQRIDEVNYLYKDIPKIMGDADDLKILVINIIKNAIEARQAGQPLVVTISTWQSDSHVCLSFADSGVGMPQSIMDSLWDGVASTKAQGNGIGMQAIKRIADEHFAEIDVKSEMGKGCEFIVKFPNSIIAEEDDERPVVNGDNVFPHVRRGD